MSNLRIHIAKKCVLLALILLPAAAGWAQQKFPLKHGEWTMTTPDPTDPSHPFVMNFCMNDEAWSRALSTKNTCTVANVNMTGSGLTYEVTCSSPRISMTGKGEWTFDGMEHIAAKSTMTMTMNGNTKSVTSQGDFRWKASSCDPNDVNLRDFTKPR
jgi:hypothetical protein